MHDHFPQPFPESLRFPQPAQHAGEGMAFSITFLGTGTSVGVPMIACDCPVCLSEDPRDNRTRCSLYVQTPQACFVVDTGPDFRQQCLREKVRAVDAVFYTHEHTDHIMGFDDLRRFTYGDHAGMPVFGPPGTLVALERIFTFAFQPTVRAASYFKPIPRPLLGSVEFAGLTVTPLPVEHGSVDTVGYLMSAGARKCFAYMSDVKRIPPTTLELLHGVEVLVLDCVREMPLPTHFSREEALAARGTVQPPPSLTLLTHLCHDFGHTALEGTLPSGVRVAYDGLKLQF